MGIKVFGFDKVLGKLGRTAAKTPTMDEQVLRELVFIAEETCNIARDTYPTRESGGYDDHTRHLRGSIGYKISFNGEEVASGGFDGRGSADGEDTARAALTKAAAADKALWEIVVVAGAEYARYVEAKGCNVITFAQSHLDEEVQKLAAKIKKGSK